MAQRWPNRMSALSSSDSPNITTNSARDGNRLNPFTIDYILSNAAANMNKQVQQQQTNEQTNTMTNIMQQTPVDLSSSLLQRFQQQQQQQHRQLAARYVQQQAHQQQRQQQQQQQRQLADRYAQRQTHPQQQISQPQQQQALGYNQEQQTNPWMYPTPPNRRVFEPAASQPNYAAQLYSPATLRAANLAYYQLLAAAAAAAAASQQAPSQPAQLISQSPVMTPENIRQAPSTSPNSSSSSTHNSTIAVARITNPTGAQQPQPQPQQQRCIATGGSSSSKADNLKPTGGAGSSKVDNLKPAHSYIGLIAMCILSSREKRMVLSDIYRFILHHYPYYRNRGNGWRNSVRHNLSLNECFQKSGRAENGKGHYWTIHPANMEDFMNGDFRRRRAQRKVRRWNLLDVPSDESDDESVEPENSRPPLPEHFKRSIEMHRQIEVMLHGSSCAIEALSRAAAVTSHSLAPTRFSTSSIEDNNCGIQQQQQFRAPQTTNEQSLLIKHESNSRAENHTKVAAGEAMLEMERYCESLRSSPSQSPSPSIPSSTRTMNGDGDDEVIVCIGCDESEANGSSGTALNTTASSLISMGTTLATTATMTKTSTTDTSDNLEHVKQAHRNIMPA